MKYLVMLGLLAATATAAAAHTIATDEIRPKPRPPMDCWVDENGDLAGCRVRK